MTAETFSTNKQQVIYMHFKCHALVTVISFQLLYYC